MPFASMPPYVSYSEPKRSQHLIVRVFVILCLALGLNLQLLAAEPTPVADEEALHRLVKQLSGIDTLSAIFVQRSADKKGSLIQEARGEVRAKRPGLFYWHTEQPMEQTIYSNGVEVTVYDPDLEQATVQKVMGATQTTPAILFSGEPEKIGELFDVELKQADGLFTQYLLTPKTKDSLFERLQVRFEGKVLMEMRLTDALGQVNVVSFDEVQINNDLPDSTFIPDLPAGTDVIRDVSGTSDENPD